MVQILTKRENIKGQYFLTARDYSKTSKGRLIAKVKWNQKTKEEYRERIKQANVYKEFVFDKKVSVNQVGLSREVTKEMGRGRLREGMFQYVGMAVSKDNKKFYGRSIAISTKSSNVVKREARAQAKERALRALAGVVLNDSDASDKEVFDAVKLFRIKIVYYDNNFYT